MSKARRDWEARRRRKGGPPRLPTSPHLLAYVIEQAMGQPGELGSLYSRLLAQEGSPRAYEIWQDAMASKGSQRARRKDQDR